VKQEGVGSNVTQDDDIVGFETLHPQRELPGGDMARHVVEIETGIQQRLF
jgi:hypothetical protein